MGRELGGMLHDEGPLGEGQSEASKRTVATSHRVTETHQQQEPYPVEEECHWNNR